MIRIENLSFSYGKMQILDGISLSAKKGDCVAVLGKNGAGKSTFITCLNKILQPTEGEIWLDGLPLTKMDRIALAREMAYVAQKNEASLMTVFDAILLGRKPYIKWSMSSTDFDLCEQVIHELDLENLKLRLLTELSGGEFQKVMLARAFVQEPKVLLLDESTSNLDPKNQYETLAMVQKRAAEKGMVVFMVLHDLNLALRFCNHFILLKEGRIFAEGEENILHEENLQAVYGIRANVHEIDGYKTVVIKE